VLVVFAFRGGQQSCNAAVQSRATGWDPLRDAKIEGWREHCIGYAWQWNGSTKKVYAGERKPRAWHGKPHEWDRVAVCGASREHTTVRIKKQHLTCSFDLILLLPFFADRNL
jgi:hypothetical protein